MMTEKYILNKQVSFEPTGSNGIMSNLKGGLGNKVSNKNDKNKFDTVR